MGIRIDLPIHTLEEANLLNETLQLRIDTLISVSNMIHTTPEEARVAGSKAEILLDLQHRLTHNE